MFLQQKLGELLTHSSCVVTKGHTYLIAQKAQKKKFSYGIF